MVGSGVFMMMAGANWVGMKIINAVDIINFLSQKAKLNNKVFMKRINLQKTPLLIVQILSI